MPTRRKDDYFLKYVINKTLHSDFSVFEKNKLPARAYAIPFADAKKLKATAAKDERYSSDTVKVLSGEWDFKYYKKKSKLPKTFDSSKVSFDKLNVPSTWQRTG